MNAAGFSERQTCKRADGKHEQLILHWHDSKIIEIGVKSRLYANFNDQPFFLSPFSEPHMFNVNLCESIFGLFAMGQIGTKAHLRDGYVVR